MTPPALRAAVCLLLGLSGAPACKQFDPPGTDEGQGPQAPATSAPDGDAQAPNGAPASPAGPVPDAGLSGPPALDPLAALRWGQVGRNHIFVPNPDQGSVTVLAADDLSISRVRAGRTPSLVAAHPDHDLALALDPDSDRIFLIDAEAAADEPAEAVDVPSGLNVMTLAPDAEHAVAYYDPERFAPSGAVGPLRSVAVIALEPELVSRSVAVPQAPRVVRFSQDGARAYVLGDAGVVRLSLADIAEDRGGSARPFDFDALAGGPVAHVAIAPDADAALVGLADRPELLWVDLDSGRTQRLALDQIDSLVGLSGGIDRDAGTMVGVPPASALSISPDGRHALLSLPELDRLVFLSLPDAFDDPEGAAPIPIALPMSAAHALAISPDGQVGSLVDNGRAPARVTIVDLGTPEEAPKTLALTAPARQQAFARQGQVFALAHADPDARLFGYTLVVPGRDAATFHETRRVPTGALVSDASEALWVLVPPEASRPATLERIDFSDFRLTRHELPPDGVTVGEAGGARRTVVLHAHADGRVTTVAFEGDEPLRTATGYNLIDRVRE